MPCHGQDFLRGIRTALMRLTRRDLSQVSDLIHEILFDQRKALKEVGRVVLHLFYTGLLLRQFLEGQTARGHGRCQLHLDLLQLQQSVAGGRGLGSRHLVHFQELCLVCFDS